MDCDSIHPTAIVHKAATIGAGVVIEPYAVINGPVVIEDGVRISSHAYIDGRTVIGKNSVVFPFASIGSRSQALLAEPIGRVIIGARCSIREYVTINSSNDLQGVTAIGDDCLLMSSVHIGHNCVLGNGVILSTGASLAGHVTIGDHAVLGGMSGVHQFVSIGAYAFLSAMTGLGNDVPPAVMVGPGGLARGLNLIGLKRHGFALPIRSALAQAYRRTIERSGDLEQELCSLEELAKLYEPVRWWIDFCRASKRGLLPCGKRHAQARFSGKQVELVSEI